MSDLRKAFTDLVLAVGNHPDAMMCTGDLHTPFMRACEALKAEEPKCAICGKTFLHERSDAAESESTLTKEKS